MADIGKILVCFTHRGREKHELVTDASRLLKLSETPDLEIDLCMKCTEISEEETTTILESIKTDKKEDEDDAEKAAAFEVYSELKAKYSFE